MTNEKTVDFPSVVRQEAVTVGVTKQKHGREIEIFAGILNTFTAGFNLMGSFEIKEDNEAEYVWLLLSTRCLHSMRCSIDLMLKGYYSQAMSLVRTGIEDWFVCGNAKNQVVRDCLLRSGKRLPSYLTLAEKMGEIGVYRSDYRFQSEFAHSSRLSLRVLQNPKTNEMRIGPVYDELLFISCAESLMRVFLFMGRYLWHVLFYIDQAKAKLWDKQNSQNIISASNWLKELRGKYRTESSLATSSE